MARGRREQIDAEDATAEHGLMQVVAAYARARGEAIDIAVLAGGEYYFLLTRSEHAVYRCSMNSTGLIIEQVQQVGGQRMAAIIIECAADHLRKGMALQRREQADAETKAAEAKAAETAPEVPHE